MPPVKPVIQICVNESLSRLWGKSAIWSIMTIMRWRWTHQFQSPKHCALGMGGSHSLFFYVSLLIFYPLFNLFTSSLPPFLNSDFIIWASSWLWTSLFLDLFGPLISTAEMETGLWVIVDRKGRWVWVRKKINVHITDKYCLSCCLEAIFDFYWTNMQLVTALCLLCMNAGTLRRHDTKVNSEVWQT